MKLVETWNFEKGQIVHWDCIYKVQGLGDEKWWQFLNGDPLTHQVVILKTINIKVETKTK